MAPRDPGTVFLRAFGRAVRARREVAKLSQEKLGFQSDLDRTYISGIERGVRNPTLKTVVRIADALKTDPEHLITAAQADFAKSMGSAPARVAAGARANQRQDRLR